MSRDRRTFLKQVGTGAAAAAAVTKLTQNAAEAADATGFQTLATARGGAQLKIALELDGDFVGWIDSVEGGSAVGEVVEEKPGEDGVTRKHIGGVKYEDISIVCGASMSKAFFEWIQASFDNKHMRKDGSIVSADFKYNAHAILDFSNALITEIGFPACDASSKDPAKLTLKFSPQIAQLTEMGGKWFKEPAAPRQKQLLASNFRFTIDGLEAASTKISKVEAITVKQSVVTDDVGDARDGLAEPGKIEFPNLKVTLSEEFAQDYFKWHEDFVIKGNNGQEQEKAGSLEFLDSNQQSFFKLNFSNVGIFAARRDKQGSDDGEVKLRTVSPQFYCEEIKFFMPNLKVD